MFVKICGITTEEDALLAVAAGADAVGFVFAPSTRQITPLAARDIARRLPSETLTVGVFRNETPRRVIDIVHEVGLKAAQLHGHESAEDSQLVARQVATLIKAFPAGHPGLDHVDDFGAAAIMLDGSAPGSGELFDWSLAEGMPSNRKIILAGGLDAENVADGIRTVKPWGVDVSSGVEKAPGRKDSQKVRRFVANARAAQPLPNAEDGLGGQLQDGLPYDWMEE
jgi:phosphoribosylanthranilate isomerase